VTERSKQPEALNPAILVGQGVDFELVQKTPEPRDERASRLRREEAEDAHRRRIDFSLHIFVMVIVTITLAVCAYVLVAMDPKTGLPDRAMGVITAIAGAIVGYIAGKKSK